MNASVQLLPPRDLPADVRAFWHESIRRQDCGNVLTRSPEWFEMMTGGEAAAGVAVVLRSESGAPRAIAPVLFREWPLSFSAGAMRLAQRQLATAKVCGGDFVDDGLLESDAASLLDALAAEHPELEGIWFDRVLSRERQSTLAQAAKRRYFVHPIHGELPHYRLRMPATAEALRQLRSPESLKKMQGRERALARSAGTVQVVELLDLAEWRPYQERMHELMNTTWQARLLGHGFCAELFQPVSDRGWLRAFLLLAGEHVVAVAICYQGMQTLVYEQIGYDQTLAKHSPGTLLLYHILERAQAAGIEFVDFGEGEAEYKRQLSNMTLQVGSCLLVRKAVSLRTLFLLNSGWRQAVGAAGAIARRTGLKKRLKAGAA
jgi:CelD/BcsL family acetyltransferase involved in cellulose biosynthesis